MWRSSLVRLASPYARAAATPALAAIRRPRAGVAARDKGGAPGVERVAPQEVDGDDGRRRGEGRREEVGDEAMAYSVPI